MTCHVSSVGSIRHRAHYDSNVLAGIDYMPLASLSDMLNKRDLASVSQQVVSIGRSYFTIGEETFAVQRSTIACCCAGSTAARDISTALKLYTRVANVLVHAVICCGFKNAFQ